VPDLATAAPHLGAELDAAAVLLAQAGVREPRRDAAQLWAALAGWRPGEAWLRRDAPADDATRRRFREAVERRVQGAPFAYAAGVAAFRTLDLTIDRRALIPRPETEGLVELALAWCRARLPGGIAVDIGTGSGCIALSLALEGRFDRVIATDVSAPAAALAQENVARVAPGTPVEVRLGDGLAPLRGLCCRVIVANPPYLTEAEWEALDPMVRDQEPAQALASGPDGLEVTRALLGGARAVLEPGGLLALEIDERRADAVRAIALETGWQVTMHRDLFDRPRYALAV
jgi:release factor glutamine methyltransferase